jgi:hypothetical protein
MSLSEGLAVLKLLIGRGAPAEAETIAIELELPQATTYTALAGLRAAGFVELLPRTSKYAVTEDVLEQIAEASRRDLVLPPRPGDVSPMEPALMDPDQHRRYTDDVEHALFAACEQQGNVILPPVRDLAVHFGLSVAWAAWVCTALVERAGACEPPERRTARNG